MLHPRVSVSLSAIIAESRYILWAIFFLIVGDEDNWILQLDEILTFNYKKQGKLTQEERANLTLRTFQRRFTRLSLGFSKKIEKLRAAIALNLVYYNFCWIPRTLGITPATATGVTEHVREVEELLPE